MGTPRHRTVAIVATALASGAGGVWLGSLLARDDAAPAVAHASDESSTEEELLREIRSLREELERARREELAAPASTAVERRPVAESIPTQELEELRGLIADLREVLRAEGHEGGDAPSGWIELLDEGVARLLVDRGWTPFDDPGVAECVRAAGERLRQTTRGYQEERAQLVAEHNAGQITYERFRELTLPLDRQHVSQREEILGELAAALDGLPR